MQVKKWIERFPRKLHRKIVQQWTFLVQHENHHAAITDNSSISNFVGDLVGRLCNIAFHISFPLLNMCQRHRRVRLRTQKRFCFTTINSRLRLMAAHYFYCYMHLTSLLCSYCCATHASLAGLLAILIEARVKEIVHFIALAFNPTDGGVKKRSSFSCAFTWMNQRKLCNRPVDA